MSVIGIDATNDHTSAVGLAGIVFISLEERGPSEEEKRLAQIDRPEH